MPTCKHPDGCPRPVKGHGWCRAHLDRVRSSGAPGPATIAARLDANRPCKVEDCTNAVTLDGGHGWCSTHYQRWRKHGSPDVVLVGGASLPKDRNPNWSGDAPSYTAAHLRVRRDRGPASAQVCTDCGQQAAHWSYDNADPAELVDPTCGRYSADSTHYAPRCVPCHSAFDAAARALGGAA